MQMYELYWKSDDGFPDMYSETVQPSLDMAYDYAAKLLQSRMNKQFHTVEIYGDQTFPDPQTIRICELCETRGTKEKNVD